MNEFKPSGLLCPKCDSVHYRYREIKEDNTVRREYYCRDCGTYSDSDFNIPDITVETKNPTEKIETPEEPRSTVDRQKMEIVNLKKKAKELDVKLDKANRLIWKLRKKVGDAEYHRLSMQVYG